MVTPTPERRDQPAGPRRRAPRRGRRDLAHRRRAGDRRARLWHRSGSRRSTSSPAPATPGSPRPSASSTAWSASTWSPGRARSSSSPTARTIPTGSPPTCSARPSTIPTSQSILFTDDAGFADAVADRGRRADRRRSPPRDVARAELGRERRDHRGRHASTRRSPLADRLAPEHLELAVRRSRGAVRRASATPASVFLGRHTPEAVGDYVAGPNHVLPTGRRARFASRACRCSIS